MVKIRLQGTKDDLKHVRRMIERNRFLEVVSISESFPNKGNKPFPDMAPQKYYRMYLDVRIKL